MVYIGNHTFMSIKFLNITDESIPSKQLSKLLRCLFTHDLYTLNSDCQITKLEVIHWLYIKSFNFHHRHISEHQCFLVEQTISVKLNNKISNQEINKNTLDYLHSQYK